MNVGIVSGGPLRSSSLILRAATFLAAQRAVCIACQPRDYSKENWGGGSCRAWTRKALTCAHSTYRLDFFRPCAVQPVEQGYVRPFKVERVGRLSACDKVHRVVPGHVLLERDQRQRWVRACGGSCRCHHDLQCCAAPVRLARQSAGASSERRARRWAYDPLSTGPVAGDLLRCGQIMDF